MEVSHLLMWEWLVFSFVCISGNIKMTMKWEWYEHDEKHYVDASTW
jgi:hypothetical protein